MNKRLNIEQKVKKMANDKHMENHGLRERTHESVDRLMDRADSVKEKAVSTKGNVDGYIQNNPEKSVLIAAGIGAVVGAILAAAMMKRRQ